ncbi:MAG: AEC family transporter [Bariatricus sp.]
MNVMTAGLQMFVMFLLILTGYFCYKTHLISKENNACLSRLVVNVFNPAMIFSSVLGNSGSGTVDSIPLLFLVSAGIFLFLIIMSKIFVRIFHETGDQKRITELLYIFANVGFVGIPVVKALLGTDKLIYVAVFILEYNILVYTYGISLLKRGAKEKEPPKAAFQLSSLKPLVNPGTIACIATLFIFITGISLPQPLGDGLQYLANATTPISLIVIGVSLGIQADLVSLFTSGKRYLFCLCKLLLLPILGTLLLKRLPLSDIMCQVYMIMMAMPSGNLILMLVEENGMEGRECSYRIILSTLMSILTIPILVFLYPYL